MYARGRENSRRLLSNSFNNSSKLDNTWRTNNKGGEQPRIDRIYLLNRIKCTKLYDPIPRKTILLVVSREIWYRDNENLSILSVLETIYLFPECSIPYLYSTEIARERKRERAAGIE